MAVNVRGVSVFEHRIKRLHERASQQDVKLFSSENDIDIWVSESTPPPTGYKVWIQHANFTKMASGAVQKALEDHELEVSVMSHYDSDHLLLDEMHVVATRDGKITSFASEKELDKFLIEEFYGSSD